MTADLQAKVARLKAELPSLALAGADTSACRDEIARLELAMAEAVAAADTQAEQMAVARSRELHRTAAGMTKAAKARIAALMCALEPPAFPGGDNA